jgi:hypothetical protein
MTSRPPEFDDLLGPEVAGEERDRLRRVHDLLIEAGPPPEVSRRGAPDTNVAPLGRRRSRRGVLALAAALATAAAFTIGLVVATGDDPAVDRVIAMSGPSGASASLEVFEIDEAGNWPMLLDIRGLQPAADGDRYELWLTKDGKPTALCGSFLTNDDGEALVSMNAPWRFSDFDGWAVVRAGSETPLLST